MTHDGECDMLIYMSLSWNVNTRAQPECWHFNWWANIYLHVTRVHHASSVLSHH